MTLPPRREAYVIYEVNLSHNDLSMVVDGFQVRFHPRLEQSVIIRGKVGLKLTSRDPQEAIDAAHNLFHKLIKVGIFLRLSGGRRGNEGRFGTMEYDFEGTPERTTKGFGSEEEAGLFIHEVVRALGCASLNARGFVHILRAYEVFERTPSGKKWVRESDWLIRTTGLKLTEDQLVNAFTGARVSEEVVSVTFKTFDIPLAQVLSSCYGVAFLFSLEERNLMTDVCLGHQPSKEVVINFELHGPMTTGARQISRVLAPHVGAVEIKKKK